MQDHDGALKRYYLPVLGLLAMLLRGCPVPITAEMQLTVESLSSSLASEDVQIIGERILGVLGLIWQHPWTPLINHRISDPTIVYLALWSLEPSGKFKSAKYVTSPIAKFEYNMRLVFLILINRHDSQEAGYQMYQRFLKEGTESTFNSLRNAQHQASSITYLTQDLPKVWWYDHKHYRELLYKGTHIHIKQLHALLAAVEQRIQHIWEEEILLGFSLRVDYKEIYDDLSSTEVGYSFWTDPRNTCFSDKLMLLRAILSDSKLSSEYISLNVNGTLRFNVHKGRSWLNNFARLHKLILLRFYLTGGSPGRGTELVFMLLLNTIMYPLRNLIAFGPYIALICTYLKTSSLCGYDKKIPHALDAFTADLIIQELAIARPFAILMAKTCYPAQPEVAKLFCNHVFVNHNKLFDTGDITDALRQFTVEFMGLELGVSDWRHISAAFRRKLCRRLDELLDEDDDESIEALQMGHNRKTDNRVYGISQEALAGAPEDVLPLFLDATTDWQIVCHVVPGGLSLSYQDALMSSFQSHVKSGLISIDTNPTTSIEQHSQQMEEHLCRLEAKVDRISHFLERRPDSSTSTSIISSSSSTDRDALLALRSLLKRSDVGWKTDGQRRSVMAVLERKHDVIAILPTNAGKSMVAILPSVLEKDLVTVIILPLRILIMDFERKLRAMGIPFCTYDSAEPRIQLGRDANLVLVSADRVRWDGWQQAVAILHQHRPVVRQVIDEAHIPLLSQDFRLALKHMSDIRCSMPIQIVLLTASGHKELLAAMRKSYAIEESAVVVHEPSNRPELRYVWQNVKDTDAMMAMIASAVQQNVRQPEDRAIIFVPWKNLGEEIAHHFMYPFYYGGNRGNRSIYQSWLAGDPPVVIATSAFGTGNDYANVRLVVHASAPYEMVYYVQEASRAGRDGSAALCLMLLLSGPNIRPSYSPSADDDLSGRMFISRTVQQPLANCIRHRITEFSDGKGVYCTSHESNQLCSGCRATQKERCVCSTVSVIQNVS
jgi:superfamily II DNA helicase RecQ